MAGELIAFTTGGPTSIPSIKTPPSLATTDTRYKGYASQAVSRSIMFPLDPFASAREAAREREELARKRAEAERIAEQERLAALERKPLLPTTSQALSLAESARAAAAGETSDTGIIDIPKGPEDWLKPPDWLANAKPGYDPLNSVVGAVGYPQSRDVYEEYGIPSRPVINDKGEVEGYAPDRPGDPGFSAVPEGMIAGSNTSRNVTSVEAAARAGGENLTNILADNVLSDPNIRNQLGRVQQQVYGAPEMIEMPDGTVMPFYSSDMVMFHGITADMQTSGYIPGRLPNPLKPDATDKEKYEYYKASKTGMFVAPRFRYGDEYTSLATMTREEKVQLQKNLKRAGYYQEGESVIPGIIQAHEINYLQDAMAEANITGLDLPDVYKMRAITLAEMKKSGYGGGGGGGGGSPTRTVDITYNTTSMKEGRAMLAGVLADALGRAPTDSELAQFMAKLNDAESKSPTKTITRYINGGGTRTSISRSTPSDVDPEQMAEEFAQGIDGGKPYEANKRDSYISGLLKSLGGFSV